jgi:hypothetical protein
LFSFLRLSSYNQKTNISSVQRNLLGLITTSASFPFFFWMAHYLHTKFSKPVCSMLLNFHSGVFISVACCSSIYLIFKPLIQLPAWIILLSDSPGGYFNSEIIILVPKDLHGVSMTCFLKMFIIFMFNSLSLLLVLPQ